MSNSIKESVVNMLDELAEEYEDTGGYDMDTSTGRHDIRRKIEDMLERKRLREEFGDLEGLDF